jgi:two-component system phosphate regulon response regulator PhoB/two-component system alkaline phosphatase synthesis response regulator PhoP
MSSLMNELIAIIDDEPDILELVALHLTRAGFSVKEFADADSFNAFIETNTPDLIVLDLMLPDTDGLELCKTLKKKDAFAAIPVIMLTAKGEETDKILGLELGADDYVTKPFSPKELVARVKAVLRRHARKVESKKIEIAGRVLIDLEKFEVTVKGKKIDLTTTEFRVLQLLASRKGYVFSRDNILNYLWGDEKAVVDRTIDVHIRHLREKLGSAASLIKNIRGIGYKLEE